MIRQLRPFYSPEELATVYTRPYDHTHWEDHIIRVSVTTHIARWMRDHVGAQSAADLSCGDGAILRGLDLSQSLYGDLVAAGHLTQDSGPLEQTLAGIGSVDLYILSETLEHVEDPALILREIRARAGALVLSTPEGEVGDENPEHYWGWDREDIQQLLAETGWIPVVSTLLNPQVPGGYTYQIWGCV